jgi:peptide subunit release factor RF-3
VAEVSMVTEVEVVADVEEFEVESLVVEEVEVELVEAEVLVELEVEDVELAEDVELVEDVESVDDEESVVGGRQSAVYSGLTIQSFEVETCVVFLVAVSSPTVIAPDKGFLTKIFPYNSPTPFT